MTDLRIMRPAVQLDCRRVHRIRVASDRSSFESLARGADGETILVVHRALLSMPSLPLCGAERTTVRAEGPAARILLARLAQDEEPVTLRAVREGAGWRVLGTAPDLR